MTPLTFLFAMIFASLCASPTFSHSEAANAIIDEPQVTCQSKRCRVSFSLADDVNYAFDMENGLNFNIFHSKLTVRKDEQLWTPGRSRDTRRSTYRGINKIATAFIENAPDKKPRLLHGVFITEKHGTITFDVDEPRKLRKEVRRLQLGNNAYGTMWTDPILFYDPDSPGSCYPSDNVTHVASVSVIVDWGFVQQAVGNEADEALQQQLILQKIQYAFSFISMIWAAQLNIRIQIGYVQVSSAASPAPFNRSPLSGCGDALEGFNLAKNYIRYSSGASTGQWAGATMVLTQCYGVFDSAGIAQIGSFCSASSGSAVALAKADPVTVAHEMGHTFGSEHSFENGIGTTGGIMDVGGSGYYMGSPQFHPGRKQQVCDTLQSLVTSQCKWFGISDIGSCGDGVLSPDEECECVPPASTEPATSCGDCDMCKLTTDDIECSTVAVIRQATDVGHIQITQRNLASPECCNSQNQVPIAQACNNGQDMCMAGGFCTPVCTSLGLTPCGVGLTGCRQKCIVLGSCLEASTRLVARNVVLNAVSTGTTCFAVPGTDLVGKCFNGFCIPADDESGEDVGAILSSPTSSPSIAKVFTTAPSKSEVKSWPTRSPVPAPTPASKKTPAPINCNPIRKKGKCNRRATCVWSAGHCQTLALAKSKKKKL